MRYRVTFDNNNGYEAVIFREFDQAAGAKAQSKAMRSLESISNIYLKLGEEIRGQSAFTVKRIEEVPE